MIGFPLAIIGSACMVFFYKDDLKKLVYKILKK